MCSTVTNDGVINLCAISLSLLLEYFAKKAPTLSDDAGKVSASAISGNRLSDPYRGFGQYGP